MRIGIDASRANVATRSGTEWYSFFIIKELLEQDRQNSYVLYTKEPLVEDLARVVQGKAEVRVLRWPPRFLWNLFRLSLEMLVRPPEVLFVPAHTVPLIHPRRLVTTCHDIGFDRFPELYARTPIGPKSGLTRWLISAIVFMCTLGRYSNSELSYHRFSMRLAIKRAQKIIVPSDFTAQEIQTAYACPHEKITVIHLGIHPDFFTRPSSDEIEKIKKKHNLQRPYAIFLGRWERKKNISTLFSAYTLATGRGAEFDLVLVGRPGLGFAEAWSLVDPGIQNRIHPLIAYNDARALMAGAAYFIFPSAYEGFGLPVLEAMAIGTPVICSNQASLPEITNDAAYLVDPSDREDIAKGMLAFQDPAVREDFRQRGLQQCRGFSWATAGRQTLALLTTWPIA